MNYTYYSFYLVKIFPVLIVIFDFDNLVTNSISDPRTFYINIIVLTVLAVIQFFMLRIQYVLLFIDRFEILGWNKYEVRNWEEATSLKVLGFGNPNVGRIKLKEGGNVYFANYKLNLISPKFFKRKDLNQNLDLVERIKFNHSI